MRFITSNTLQIALLAIIGLASAQQQPSNSTDIGTPSAPSATSSESTVPSAANAPNSSVNISNSTGRPLPSKYMWLYTYDLR